MGRKHIGLFFSYNANWIGGTYYWLNWVNVLNVLPDAEKPILTIICKNRRDFAFVQSETKYPYLLYKRDKSSYSLLQKALNAITLRLIHKRVFVSKLKGDFDAVLPASIESEYLSSIPDEKKINWFPDFQYAHFPELYTPKTLTDAQCCAVHAAYMSNKLMLSSEDAKRDFISLFPASKAKVYVQHFTVTHPDISNVDKERVLFKYGIDRPYYYSPNQYWAHKNHMVVIKAVEQLVKDVGKDILVLFSGKEWDDRNPEYVRNIKQYVSDRGLCNYIKFLGFIERKEQLLIMKEAIAVIQPSLFEGWSTVIEDAKALNKYVIASRIPVNQEQLNMNCCFFDPISPIELATIIKHKHFDVIPCEYSIHRLEQARRFMNMVND